MITHLYFYKGTENNVGYFISNRVETWSIKSVFKSDKPENYDFNQIHLKIFYRFHEATGPYLQDGVSKFGLINFRLYNCH